jgi:3-oxoacyl-[acyl-carrier protein] reductase
VNELAGKTALVTGIAHGVDKDTVDVTDPAAVARLIEKIGPVDILVNNAGGVVGQVHHPIEEIRDEDWRAVVDANLTSTFMCTRAVAPGMKAAGSGRIVNISSGAGRSVSLTGIQAYASS